MVDDMTTVVNSRTQQIIPLTSMTTIGHIRDQVFKILELGHYGHALVTVVGNQAKVEFKLEGAPECEKRTFWR